MTGADRMTTPIARTLALAAVTAAAALALPAGARAGSACAAADDLPAGGSGKAAARATLCLVNQQRTSRGLKPLTAQGALRRIAQRYAEEMVEHRFFAHDSAVTGSTLESRVRASGYLRGARSWRVGENLAWGEGERATPRYAVTSWMRSPHHKANILQRSFRHLGIGIAPGAPAAADGPAATYVTDFGMRR